MKAKKKKNEERERERRIQKHGEERTQCLQIEGNPKWRSEKDFAWIFSLFALLLILVTIGS